MVHHMTLPKGLVPDSTFEKKLSGKEVSGNEAHLTWKLQDPVLVLDVSRVSMYLRT